VNASMWQEITWSAGVNARAAGTATLRVYVAGRQDGR